jgi:beta-xylosidase
VTFTVHADLTSFVGLAGHRVVEPGDVDLLVSRSSAEVSTRLGLRLVGEERRADHTRELVTGVEVGAPTGGRP